MLYTGNDLRTNTELRVYGGVGEHQLAWTRYVNSRATNGGQYFGTIGMRHGYQWEMADAGLNSSGQAQLTVNYPDGNICTFAHTTTTEWHSTASITDILYQQGTQFTLQRQNGWQYYFSKLTDGSGNVYYQCTGFADSQQNNYTFTYDTANRLVKVTEPAGRWLQINYQGLPVTSVDFVTLATVTSVPASGQWTQLTVTDPGSYRYLRYFGPNDSGSAVNEIQFFAVGSSTPLSGTPFGTTPAYASGTEFDKAFDGNVGTGFLANNPTGSFTGIDLGAGNAQRIGTVKFYPTPGKESAMYQVHSWLQSGVFQGSNQLPQTTSVISSVQSSDGRTITYSYTSLADSVLPSLFQLLSSVTYDDGNQAQYTYTQVFQGTHPLVSTAIEPRNLMPYAKVQNYYFGDQNETLGMVQSQVNLVTGETLSSFGIANTNLHSPLVTYAGGQVNWSYMSNGLQTYKADAMGNGTSYAYDNKNSGFLTTATDPLGRVTKRTYTKYNSDLTRTYADGKVDTWTRDSIDRVLTYKDRLLHTTTFTRDTHGRVTAAAYPDGSHEYWTYNAFSEILTHTLRTGGVQQFTYDSRGLKTSSTDPLGNTTTYTYDSQDRPVATTDARGNTTQYVYNALGQMTKMTHPDGTFISYQYDNFGNQTSVTNELGKTWTTVYDAIRRVVSNTDPLGNTTQYAYPDAAATQPSLVTLPSGKKIAFTYDANFRVTSKTTGYGTADAATITYAYDSVGNLLSNTDPKGGVWSYTYDVMNRTLSKTAPIVATKTIYTYDGNGNKLTEKRPDNGVTTYVYDTMNRVTKITDPKGQITQMTYDAAGNLLTVKDPRNNTYSYTYDTLNRKTAMIYPDSSHENWTYDATGNLATYTARGGQVQTFAYDNRNRNTGYSWSDGVTPAVAKSYDAAGRLLTVNNGVSTVGYGYDDGNYLLSDTQTIAGSGAGGKTIAYTHDADGNRVSATYPSATVVAYGYTGRSQLAGVSVGGTPLAAFTYDGNGNRTGKSLANGTTAAYAYDANNRLLALSHKLSTTNIASFTYAYDSMGRRTSRSESSATAPAATDSYSYDAVDQVTAVGYGSGRNVSYTYDASGNRTSVTDSGTASAYVANSLNQYVTANGAIHSYDANGNLQSTSVWNYTYDAQNRLISASNGTTTATLAYDAANRCVARTINGTTTYLYYNGWQLIEEHDGSDNLLASYVHGAGLDELLTRTSSAGTFYYHEDGLGNVVKLTDSTGTVQEGYSYDVFGAVTIRDGSGTVLTASPSGNRFLYTGREYIAELGLYDYRNRVYSPSLGRFLQTDPIRFEAGDVNIYRYVGNDPIGLTDLMGLNAAAAWSALEGAAGRAGAAEAVGLGPENPIADIAATGLLLYGVYDALNAYFNENNGSGGEGGNNTGGKSTEQPQEIDSDGNPVPSGTLTPTGEVVTEPSVKYPGGTSTEEVYTDAEGKPVTKHTLTDKNGKIKDQHYRPGKPKGGDVIKIHDSLNVSEEDIFTSLRKLIGEKFAQAYEYDSTKQEFIEVEFPENISSNYWFYITRAGVGCLCENQKVHPEQ